DLVHSVFAAQRLHPVDTIIGISEDAHLAIEVLVFYPFDAGQDLPECLKALDVCLAEGPQSLRCLAQEAQKAGLALLAGPRSARPDMSREKQTKNASGARGGGG